MPNPVYYKLTLALNRERKGGNGMVKDMISNVVKALVDQPDQVSVNEVEGSHTIVLELKVAKSDMGKVIGKQGRNAQALRTILGAAAGKHRKRYVLEIVE
jgi:hypothetical protein